MPARMRLLCARIVWRLDDWNHRAPVYSRWLCDLNERLIWGSESH